MITAAIFYDVANGLIFDNVGRTPFELAAISAETSTIPGSHQGNWQARAAKVNGDNITQAFLDAGYHPLHQTNKFAHSVSNEFSIQ